MKNTPTINPYDLMLVSKSHYEELTFKISKYREQY